VHASVTRGNYYKLVPQHCKYDLRKHYFTNRVVPVWNSLPNNVVMAENINIFKNHPDKFWSSYDFVYDNYISRAHARSVTASNLLLTVRRRRALMRSNRAL